MTIALVYFSDNELHCLEVGYALSALKQVSKKVNLHMITQLNFERIIDLVSNDVVVFCLSYGCSELLYQACKSLKKENADVYNIVCGQIATKLYKTILNENYYVDLVVVGEYETTLYDICKRISLSEDFTNCNGIAYIKDEIICLTPPRCLSEIETIAYPDRDFLDNTRYFHIYGSRGCEANCSFCDRNSLYLNSKKGFRMRGIRDIMVEVDELVERYNCKFIMISDPTFCSSSQSSSRLMELYVELKKRNYWVQFGLNLRAELINNDVIAKLKLLKKVGLGNVFIGIESFNENDLKLFGKKSNLQNVLDCIELLGNNFSLIGDDHYLKVEYGFINFNPYTSFENLQNNLKNFKNNNIYLNPYLISTRLTLNSLTTLTKKVDYDGLFKKKLSEFDLNDLMQFNFEYNFLKPEISEIYELINRFCNKENIINATGLEIIRNRYYHFYGYDKIVQRFDITYLERTSLISDFAYQITSYILDNFNEGDIICNLKTIEQNFFDNYESVNRKMETVSKRALIQLEKIDENIYYKSIF